MIITIELIDELRKRANVSFESAKEALESCNGDLIEALIYLEKTNKIETPTSNDKEKLINKAKELLGKTNNTKFIVSKEGKTVVNLPLTATILIGTFTFHVSAIAMGVGLFSGYKFKLEKNNGEDVKVNDVINKVQDNIDSFKQKLNEDKAK